VLQGASRPKDDPLPAAPRDLLFPKLVTLGLLVGVALVSALRWSQPRAPLSDDVYARAARAHLLAPNEVERRVLRKLQARLSAP
jgi:cytochrome c-type biogenesis protein CcmH/NrfG